MVSLHSASRVSYRCSLVSSLAAFTTGTLRLIKVSVRDRRIYWYCKDCQVQLGLTGLCENWINPKTVLKGFTVRGIWGGGTARFQTLSHIHNHLHLKATLTLLEHQSFKLIFHAFRSCSSLIQRAILKTGMWLCQTGRDTGMLLGRLLVHTRTNSSAVRHPVLRLRSYEWQDCLSLCLSFIDTVIQ